jgi:hypothetical protein
MGWGEIMQTIFIIQHVETFHSPWLLIVLPELLEIQNIKSLGCVIQVEKIFRSKRYLGRKDI